jgi:hypothetical protein
MLDRAQKVRYCIARFEELLPKGTSAELAKLYLAETTAARAQLADMEHRAAKDRGRAAAPRDRFVADSALEESGFEPSVPLGEKRSFRNASIRELHRAAYRGGRKRYRLDRGSQVRTRLAGGGGSLIPASGDSQMW